jgi:CubicO group peptidase (beta-lactamase class C family)
MLEVAGGADFPALVDREVARPLALSTLTVDRRGAIVPGRVAFYDRDAGAPATLAGVHNAKSVNVSYKWAGGGLLMSAEDLARFGAAHLSPGYLSAGSLRSLFTKQTRADGTEIGVGLAWRIGRDAAGRAIHHHSGSQEGSRAFLLLVPDDRLVVAFLSNLGGIPSNPLDHALALAAPFLDAANPEGSAR